MNSVLITQCVCSCAFSRLLWHFPSAASPLFLPHAVFTTSTPLPLCPISTPTHPILFRCWYLEAPAQWNKQPHNKQPHALSEAGLLAAGMLGSRPQLEKLGCANSTTSNPWLRVSLAKHQQGSEQWLTTFYMVRMIDFLFCPTSAFPRIDFPNSEFWGLLPDLPYLGFFFP